MAETTQSASLFSALLPFVLMLAIFYFLLIRPQQKQQKARQAMLDGLKKGNKIITIGGIYGEIVEVKEDTLIIRVADKVEIKTTRGAVSQVIS
ncbi:MAG: preprotein translocase subunit YajC [Firmicutes bacterium]|nr:preprotein translocase subunit YajC [Bacillota bacterium]